MFCPFLMFPQGLSFHFYTVFVTFVLNGTLVVGLTCEGSFPRSFPRISTDIETVVNQVIQNFSINY